MERSGGKALLDCTPVDLLARWPADLPIIGLVSGGAAGERNRRSVIGVPTRVERLRAGQGDPLTWMRERLRAAAPKPPGDEGTFRGGWVVALSYELGREIEPAAEHREPGCMMGDGARRIDPDWPWSVVMWRLDRALVHDGRAGSWSIEGGGPPGEIERALGSLGEAREGRVCQLRAAVGQARFEDQVRRGREYVCAGDVFQVNLSHTLEGRASGSARGLFGRLMRRAGAWYGAYLEVEDQAGGPRSFALSVSPELFLEFDARTRRIETRPIKGTRTTGQGEAALRESLKDQAELNMIVDLMRNDLGRIAEIGSVRVEESRRIEQHAAGEGLPGVLHGVATVSARVRTGLDAAHALWATFPAGSITGAPKIRAMQIIEEIEGRARGLYTGAIGLISDDGDVVFNVAIRTAVIRDTHSHGTARDALDDARFRYGVGAGIVADSDPGAEWLETLDKAGVVRDISEGGDIGAG